MQLLRFLLLEESLFCIRFSIYLSFLSDLLSYHSLHLLILFLNHNLFVTRFTDREFQTQKKPHTVAFLIQQNLRL
ncbi:hypothetical protein VCRA2119O48_20008 [Vibrio crassostreae]|nr:hypothetical protein VCRA2119O48_20008 [Vibrio crassostreae]CAK3927640.1 hypothetical protein VCRA212O16_30008 [Vibrio crassostreae]